MFQNFCPNARQCYDRAVIARDRADRAGADGNRDDWLKLELGWLALGQSYEFADRLQSALLVSCFAFAAATVVGRIVLG